MFESSRRRSWRPSAASAASSSATTSARALTSPSPSFTASSHFRLARICFLYNFFCFLTYMGRCADFWRIPCHFPLLRLFFRSRSLPFLQLSFKSSNKYIRSILIFFYRNLIFSARFDLKRVQRHLRDLPRSYLELHAHWCTYFSLFPDASLLYFNMSLFICRESRQGPF